MAQRASSLFLAPSPITTAEETPLVLADDLSLELRKSRLPKQPPSKPHVRHEERARGSVDLLCKEFMAIPFRPSLLKAEDAAVHDSDATRRGRIPSPGRDPSAGERCSR